MPQYFLLQLVVVVAVVAEVAADVVDVEHSETRCSCKCPLIETAWFGIETAPGPMRSMYINTHVTETDCDCEHVVRPVLQLNQVGKITN